VTASRTHRLEGLEPDNLLAFLALLGLLRALEAAGWRPRAHWEGTPLRPVLTVLEERTAEEVAAASAEGCRALAPRYEFEGRESLNYTAAELRTFLASAGDERSLEWAHRQEIMAPLLHESARKPGKDGEDGALERSPLNCLDVAQVKFLKSLAEATRAVAEPGRMADQIRSAVFEPWLRKDRFTTFRWDPLEDRRHAYRATAPTSDPVRTQAGAVRLAAFGIVLLPAVAVQHRGRLRILPLGFRHGGGETSITWPIWEQPASATALRALLAHPALSRDSLVLDQLRALSIVGAFRARRIMVDKYGNFTRAERV
jgi:hypothetical protein